MAVKEISRISYSNENVGRLTEEPFGTHFSRCDNISLPEPKRYSRLFNFLKNAVHFQKRYLNENLAKPFKHHIKSTIE